jgi:hypothetical protein
MSKSLPIGESVANCIGTWNDKKSSMVVQISSLNETIKGLHAKHAAIALQMLALMMQQKQIEDEQKRQEEQVSSLKRELEIFDSIDFGYMTSNIRKAIEASLPGDVIKANECHTHYDAAYTSHPFTFPTPTSTKVEDVNDEMDFCGLDAFDSLPPSCTLPSTVVQKSESESESKTNTKTHTKTKPTRRIARHKYDNMSAQLGIFNALPNYMTYHNREAYNRSVDAMQDIVRDKQKTNSYKTTALLSLINQYNKKFVLVDGRVVDGKELLTMEKYLALCNEASL